MKKKKKLLIFMYIQVYDELRILVKKNLKLRVFKYLRIVKKKIGIDMWVRVVESVIYASIIYC